MFGKICPYCKERIKKDALICRYCHKELDVPEDGNCSSSLWVLAGFVGLFLGAATALGFGYLNERRRWEADTEEVAFHEDTDSNQ